MRCWAKKSSQSKRFMTSPSLWKAMQNFSDAFFEAEAKAPPYRRNQVPEDADGSPVYPPAAAMVIETTSLANNEAHLDRESLRESRWYWRRLVPSIASRRIVL